MEDYLLKFYSPLTAELEINPEDYEDMATLYGEDLIYYQDAILQGIEDEALPEEADRGLMAYFYGSNAVDQKVSAVHVTVEPWHGKLYGVALCHVKGPLTGDELNELKEYISGQYSDGWGEGFEQRPRRTEAGDLYVHFWQDSGFFIKTASEMEQSRQHSQTKKRGGEAR